MKKAALIIHGISEKVYMQDVKIYLEDSGYDEVVIMELDKIFDKSIFRFVPFYDKYGDITQFFFNKRNRRKLRKYLNKILINLEKQGYEVDIYAHSLGTLVALLSNRTIDNLYMLSSPLSMAAVGWKVRKEMRKRVRLTINKEVYYIYGKKDLISNKKVKTAIKFLHKNLKRTFSSSYHIFNIGVENMKHTPVLSLLIYGQNKIRGIKRNV
jgi:hypothetical protein